MGRWAWLGDEGLQGAQAGHTEAQVAPVALLQLLQVLSWRGLLLSTLGSSQVCCSRVSRLLWTPKDW